MESAIPAHLQCPRSRQRRIADDYDPPFPATVARFGAGVKQVVMAYFGVQYEGAAAPAAAATALAYIADAYDGPDGPGHWDRARYVDEAGFTNLLSIGYWDDPAVYAAWFATHGERWGSGAFAGDGVGTFIETLQPTSDRFETLFAGDLPEGIAGVGAGFSGDFIQEHGYWGGMRDRIPLSQTSDMAPAGEPRLVTDGKRQRIVPHENICLIRSGQDWRSTETEERRMYLEDVEPVLRAGMDFLRDDGRQVDCYANRYVTIVDRDGRPTEKSFGMGWWKSLDALERWAESHPTHVAIFGAAMRYLSALGPAAKLKLYHEVTVASANEQSFEYFNCHPRTGMLRVGA